jgi:hypothetical protein
MMRVSLGCIDLPIALGDDHERRPEAGGVPTVLTVIAQQDPLRVVVMTWSNDQLSAMIM